MAGKLKKVAKLASFVAAGAGAYHVGRKAGVKEADAPEASAAKATASAGGLERTPGIPFPGMTSTAEKAGTYCAEVATALHEPGTGQQTASDLLRMRVKQPDRIPASPRALINERAQGLKVRVVDAAYSDGSIIERFDRIVQGKPTSAPAQIDKDSAILAATESPSDSSESDSKSEDVSDDAKGATEELQPYAKIEDAISSSDFFVGDSEQRPSAPKPFSMP